MPMKFKIDVLAALKAKGMNSSVLREQNLLSQSTIQKLRKKEGQLSWDNIEQICRLLEMQPGDLLEYIPDNLPERP